MHQLVMPFPLSGFEVNCNERFSKQPVTRSMTSINISGGQFDGEVRESEIFVHTDLSPDAAVAVDVRRLVFPRVVTEFAGSGNGVKDPQSLTVLPATTGVA